MIRSAGAKADGTPFVLLGLDAQNLDRMREGQPISVNLRNLDPDGPPVEQLPDLDVVIYFAGADEQAILSRFLQPGAEHEHSWGPWVSMRRPALGMNVFRRCTTAGCTQEERAVSFPNPEGAS